MNEQWRPSTGATGGISSSNNKIYQNYMDAQSGRQDMQKSVLIADLSSREELVQLFETFNPSHRRVDHTDDIFEERKINDMIREFADEENREITLAYLNRNEIQ